MDKSTTSRTRILIVDSNDGPRQVVYEVLCDDYECEAVDSAEKALTLFRENHFNLVISDIVLSGINSNEMMAEMVGISPTTPIIVISGEQRIESAIQAIQVGVFDYLMKPFDLNQLVMAVERALNHQDLLQFKQLHQAQLEELKRRLEESEKQKADSVFMSFNFPAEVRVACEQYLLYFAQFLNDLGVEADTALTHQAGQVLFTVTPTDKQHALDKIHAALNVYLHLSSSPISDTANEAIEIQRLEAGVLRLRSDLRLASAELQAKNISIEAQQLIIDVQRSLLSGEVVINSIKHVTPKPKDEDKEELLGDIVSLVPLKGKGFEVNLPELFRRLKLLFKKDE